MWLCTLCDLSGVQLVSFRGMTQLQTTTASAVSPSPWLLSVCHYNCEHETDVFIECTASFPPDHPRTPGNQGAILNLSYLSSLFQRVERKDREVFPDSNKSREKPFKLYKDNKDIKVWLDPKDLNTDGWELDKKDPTQVNRIRRDNVMEEGEGGGGGASNLLSVLREILHLPF